MINELPQPAIQLAKELGGAARKKLSMALNTNLGLIEKLDDNEIDEFINLLWAEIFPEIEIENE